MKIVILLKRRPTDLLENGRWPFSYLHSLDTNAPRGRDGVGCGEDMLLNPRVMVGFEPTGVRAVVRLRAEAKWIKATCDIQAVA